jgi:eukaryotic-like serine/threonine-protein kinase
MLNPGTKIGPYEVHGSLGAGGMGEVYRASDKRLGRDVAIKILPGSFSAESDRLRRFQQEAHAVAALNHPNILGVFDTGQYEGSPFLVTELLEGETLRELLDHGSLPQRKAIEYGGQIAQGLAAAHEKGLVHRDVKPENIFVTRDGRIKVLDFGLAKLTQKASAAGADTEGATMTSSHTAAGMVMGTAGYMSPEQVRGGDVDCRTDIFALGAVLYEMLSGRSAFRRDTPAETMTAVLREDPPEIATAEHLVSPALDRIVRRCLEKDPEQRFQSARDLSFALSALSGTSSSGANQFATAQRKFPGWLWPVVAVAIVVAAGVTWLVAHRAPPEVSMQFAIPVSGEVSYMALSPNGSLFAYVSPDENTGIPMLHLQPVGSPDTRVLPGTEGATYPFWSPDSEYIAFFGNGKLQKLAVAGGSPQALTKVWSARGGSWGRRNVIIYEPDSGSPIWRINADGSDAEPVTDKLLKADEQSHRWPVFLPDGNHFLFWAGNFGGSKDDQQSAIYLSSLDGKEKTRVIAAHSSFALDSGHLYYADDAGHLVSVPFNLEKGTVAGNPEMLANTVALQPSTYWASLTASKNGDLVYNANLGTSLSVLTWMDRSGKALGVVGDPAVQFNPKLSPDGTRVAVDVSDQKANNVDVWLESTRDAGNSRFTFDPAEEVVPVWSRDGRTIAFRSAGGNTGFGGLMLKSSNGLEAQKAALKLKLGDEDVIPDSWAPGDRQVLCTHEMTNGYRLLLVDVDGKNTTPLQLGPDNQIDGMISPDGRWLAYASDESGSWEIYVTTFPGLAGKWQVSRGGGTEPRWRADGKEIFYLAPGGMLTSAAVSTLGTFASGTPVSLFQFRGRAPISSTDFFSYDVTADGKRFLVNRYLKPERVEPLTIILHADARTSQ